MTRIAARWIVAISLGLASCGKDAGPRQTSPGGGVSSGSGTSGSVADRGASWSRVIAAGKYASINDITAGASGALVTINRTPSEPLAIDGKQRLPPDDRNGLGLVLLDAAGQARSAVVLPTPSGERSLVALGKETLLAINHPESDLGLGVELDTLGGAVYGFSSLDKPVSVLPIKGDVTGMTRTRSGTLWVAGTRWAYGGECEMKAFVARRDANDALTPIACGEQWGAIKLAASGDDVVACGSSMLGPIEIGPPVEAKTFLVRFAPDGKPRWLRAINEIGRSVCEQVAVAPDGDVVAFGLADENADFTEGALAKGGKPVPSGGGEIGHDLWIARYSGDGIRRWARAVSGVFPGNPASFAVDRDSNALLVAATTRALDTGHGPIGTGDEDAIVASIDRDGHVRGHLSINGTSQSAIAADPQGGILIGVSIDRTTKVGDQTIEVPKKQQVVAVVRLTALPPPPRP